MIEFLCPNGHRIRCSADRAGQAAKCPKCGVKFRVPRADDAPPASGDSGSAVAASPTSQEASGLKSGPSSGLGAKDQIEFLCPNGHRLHGPKHLQGKPGQCPECGCKFLVPNYDDADEAVEGLAQPVAAGEDSALNLPDAKRAGDSGKRPPPPSVETLRAALQPGGSSTIQRPQPAASLAEVLSRLWAKKADGAVIEVHLTDGQTLVPDRFAPAASQGSHAVFATQEADGSYSLTVAAWANVARLVVRRLRDLPEEFAR
jgi:hypothetical protein